MEICGKERKEKIYLPRATTFSFIFFSNFLDSREYEKRDLQEKKYLLSMEGLEKRAVRIKI